MESQQSLPFKQKLQEFSTLCIIQIVSYALMCINYRAVAQAHYMQSAISDFMISSLSFFVIKKIAHGQDNFHQWAGYATGSVIGSFVGIYLSKILLGN
jgi:uncharacterized membrane protein YfcA